MLISSLMSSAKLLTYSWITSRNGSLKNLGLLLHKKSAHKKSPRKVCRNRLPEAFLSKVISVGIVFKKLFLMVYYSMP